MVIFYSELNGSISVSVDDDEEQISTTLGEIRFSHAHNQYVFLPHRFCEVIIGDWMSEIVKELFKLNNRQLKILEIVD